MARSDVVDLTELERRGIWKSRVGVDDSGEYEDLTPSAPSVGGSANAFDFLDSLAGSGSSTGAVSSSDSSGDVEHLKVKFDDLEYKMDRLMERLEMMEAKMRMVGG